MLAGLEVNITESPLHSVVAPPGVMVGVEAELTVTVTGVDVAEHPLDDVVVRKCVPDVDTVMAWVVSPVGDHRNVSAGAAVKITESPVQKPVGPLGVIVAVGTTFTVTVTAVALPGQPSETVTLCVPVVSIVVVCVVSPLDHE